LIFDAFGLGIGLLEKGRGEKYLAGDSNLKPDRVIAEYYFKMKCLFLN